MTLRLLARRFERALCMVGIHQFREDVARCAAPGCRAPNPVPQSMVTESEGNPKSIADTRGASGRPLTPDHEAMDPRRSSTAVSGQAVMWAEGGRRPPGGGIGRAA